MITPVSLLAEVCWPAAMTEILSGSQLLLVAGLLWLGFALLSFVNGVLRGFHRLRWFALSLLLGPFALIVGLFLPARRGRSPVEKPFDRRKLGDLFEGKPLYSEEIRELKRQKRFDEAVDLLQLLVEAAEEKSRESGKPLPPWYYEQLSDIYRRQGKLRAERAILERYCSRVAAPDARARRLTSRLERLKQR